MSGNSGSASYIFSGKTSYLEQSSKLFYSYIDTAGLPFNYTDLYGKVSLNGASGSKINLFGFKFSDKVKYSQCNEGYNTVKQSFTKGNNICKALLTVSPYIEDISLDEKQVKKIEAKLKKINDTGIVEKIRTSIGNMTVNATNFDATLRKITTLIEGEGK